MAKVTPNTYMYCIKRTASPPHLQVHPLRVIFMISRDAPPRLEQQPEQWSPLFHDFIAQVQFDHTWMIFMF